MKRTINKPRRRPMNTELTYPKFRSNKNVLVKFAPNVGTLACTYNQVVRAFGQPSLSIDNNDTFDGTEQCCWLVQFETGETVSISENRAFGNTEAHYNNSHEWKINTRSVRTYEWIKSIIRDANPSANG